MGYRNYLGKVSKDVYLETKDLSKKQLCEKYPEGADIDEYGGEVHYYFDSSMLPTYKELHELGKYCDFPIDELKENFFTKWDCSDTEFSVCEKELLLAIIEDYRKTVLNWYQSQLDEPFEKLQENYRNMIREWGGDKWDMRTYDLDESREDIVKSWKYEYVIFELVRIYKSFDWENDVLIYSGR